MIRSATSRKFTRAARGNAVRITTPDGLADPARAVTALEESAKEVLAAYKALDVPWGDVYRLPHAGMDVASNGATDQYGCFDQAWYGPNQDGTFALEGGDTFIAAVELGTTVRAKALLGYGNGSQPDSPHRTEQLPLLSNKQLRDVWRTRA